MINFNKGTEQLNKFMGSEAKTTLRYENEVYMIKYPDPIREEHNILSYMNNQYSEYIGSNIFKSCYFETQETVLGYCNVNGKEKIVVGCKDFTQNGGSLHEFSKLANQTLIEKKPETSIEIVNEVISRSNLIKNKKEVLNKFWDMFVVDTLIGNTDRHFDNWGVIERSGEVKFAPIYDCGSSLAALVGDEEMENLLNNPPAFKNQEFNLTSCYYMNGKRIFCHEIFKNPPAELEEAIKRITPKIEINKIRSIVNSAESMSDVRKKYLKRALDMRHEQIIVPAFKRVYNEKFLINKLHSGRECR